MLYVDRAITQFSKQLVLIIAVKGGHVKHYSSITTLHWNDQVQSLPKRCLSFFLRSMFKLQQNEDSWPVAAVRFLSVHKACT